MLHLNRLIALGVAASAAVLSTGCTERVLAPGQRAPIEAVYFGVEGLGVIYEGSTAVEPVRGVDLPLGGVGLWSEDLSWIVMHGVQGRSLAESREGHLVAFDICTGSERWSVPTEAVAGRAVLPLALSAEGHRLVLGGVARQRTVNGQTDLVWGPAVLDGSTMEVLSFFEGFQQTVSAHVISPGLISDEGAILIEGKRWWGDPKIYTASVGGELLDSIGPEDVGGQRIGQFVPGTDGSIAFVVGWRSLLKMDLLSKEVIATAARPSFGGLAFWTVGDGTVLLTSSGNWDAPGSGYVYRLGPDLQELARIDVSTPLGGTPGNGSIDATVTGTVAVDQERRKAYVVKGNTGPVGPLYPHQPPGVIVLDLETNEVERVVDTSELGLGQVGLISDCPGVS